MTTEPRTSPEAGARVGRYDPKSFEQKWRDRWEADGLYVARDGRRWILRPARPNDGRALARLFADVRGEGRWLITSPAAVSEPSEAFWISEMIRADEHLVLVAEAGGEIVGNVLVSVDRNAATEHIGVLSILLADGWRDIGIGSELVAAAQRWTAERGLRKLSLGVFPDNARAIAVYERAGFVREGVRRLQYRSGDALRDELLMAWFPADDGRPGADAIREERT